jgi:hypothetical protein
MTITGTSARHTWLKFTDTHRSEVFPMAMFSENMTEKARIVRKCDPSSCLGFTVLSQAPTQTVRHANAIVRNNKIVYLEKQKYI